MANTRSAGKRARQTLRRSAHNRSVKTHLRRLQKQIRSAPERTADQIRAAISAIDKAANVVIDKAAGQYATAHDLRRSFGSRWAKRVMSAVLKDLMRHSSVSTTMSY